MRRRYLTLWGFAFLTACVSAPERRPVDLDVPVPDQWTAGADATEAEIDGQWWQSFEDPTLSSLVDTALERNYDLQAAAARLERAIAAARIAGADLKPSLGIGVSASRGRQNFIGLPIPGAPQDGVLSSTTSQFGIGLDAAWEADLWGRIRAGARAAVAEAEASRADLRAARLSLAGQTAKIWFSILETRQQLDLARDSAESFRDSAAQVRTRYERGIRSALDLRLALSNLAGAEALVQVRNEQLDRATRLLEVLVGSYPGGSLVDGQGGRVLPPPPAEIPVGLPADLVARRPDVAAAERRLAASDQRYVAARRSLYPRLSLTAGGGTASESLSDLLDGDFRVWSLVGNLTQPLFQGGRLRAGVDAAASGRDEVLARYASAVLLAFSEVESALAAEQFLADQERHLADATEQLKAARRLAEDRYQEGIGIYLTVLESQSRALNAESQLLSVRRQRLDNRIDLHLALGGGFEESLDTPTGEPSAEVVEGGSRSS